MKRELIDNVALFCFTIVDIMLITLVLFIIILTSNLTDSERRELIDKMLYKKRNELGCHT